MLQVELVGQPAAHVPDEPEVAYSQTSLEQLFLNVIVLDVCACAPIRPERMRREAIMDIFGGRMGVGSVECDESCCLTEVRNPSLYTMFRLAVSTASKTRILI